MGDPKQVGLNTRAIDLHTYDAIVVGSGISGGWAAKELCEKGLKTLVLERGRNVEHVKDYTTANMHPWEFKHRLNLTEKDKAENPLKGRDANEGNEHFFVNDKDYPFIQEKPFFWTRGYQVGGRSLTWGRMCLRYGERDFRDNEKDGIGVDWPIRYKDLAPWYDYVEAYIGVSGQKEGLAHMPDGVYLPPMEMNCIEKHFSDKI